MSSPLLWFEQEIDPINYQLFRTNTPKDAVHSKLIAKNGDPTHVIMASVDFATLGEIRKSADLLYGLTSLLNVEGKKPSKGIASLGEESLAHLITWHAFGIIQIANEHNVNQAETTTRGILSATNRVGKLSRTHELMQSGFEEYIKYVGRINKELTKPITWASYYALLYLDKDSLGIQQT